MQPCDWLNLNCISWSVLALLPGLDEGGKYVYTGTEAGAMS